MVKRFVLFSLIILLTLLLLGSGLFWYSRPWDRALFVTPLHRLPTNEKVAALTFDDGPSLERTPPLLEVLKRHQVKATFFMLGTNIERHPGLARRVISEGHLVGNHSYDHPRMYAKPLSFLRWQIEQTDSLIQAAGQEEVKLFRPPYSAKFILLPWLLNSMGKTLVTGT